MIAEVTVILAGSVPAAIPATVAASRMVIYAFTKFVVTASDNVADEFAKPENDAVSL